VTRRYTLDVSASIPAGIDYAAELNPQQLAAVTSAPGAALVIAGAGSGKTRTLTYRVAWLLEQGVPARSILLLTFTNKAAREMVDRVASLLPHGAGGIWGGTFHSIGNRILRRHAERVGFRSAFTIMDREDQDEMLASIIAREGLRTNDRRFPKAEVLADIFSFCVNTSASLPQVLRAKFPYFIPLAEQIARVQSAYEARKREANAMDFDDLLSKTLELFQAAEDVAAIYQDQFHHVLVDEYQDTNRIQSDLVDLIARRHGNIMVVGDDAQSIYSWRGANFENILKFPAKHPEAQVFKIETNYRSVPEVLQVANAAIRANERQFRKELVATRKSHPMKPALVPLSTNSQQAAFVAQRVLELHEEGIELHEMAVLYRAHYHSMEVQLEFTRRGIPFTITSGLRFFEQAHVKDVAAFLKFAVNPRDETAFKRMVKLFPGVGPKSAEALWSQANVALEGRRDFGLLRDIRPPAKAQESWDQFVHTMVELAPSSGILAPSAMIESVAFAIYDDYMKSKFANYEARREDINTLSAFAKQFDSTEDFLSQLALLGAVETADAFRGEGESEKVTLSTIHQAKGLEWKVIFLIWLTEGMFPSARSVENPDALEEERRLFYVGITRCRDELYITYPDMRLNASYSEALQRPSRFLSEIPENLLETWEISAAISRPGEPF
jgi:DNA helicase II / ATP-dependent DNA helicase PcrA